jgi:hypothetical protein
MEHILVVSVDDSCLKARYALYPYKDNITFCIHDLEVDLKTTIADNCQRLERGASSGVDSPSRAARRSLLAEGIATSVRLCPEFLVATIKPSSRCRGWT